VDHYYYTYNKGRSKPRQTIFPMKKNWRKENQNEPIKVRLYYRYYFKNNLKRNFYGNISLPI